MTKNILVTARSFRRMDGPHKQILLDAGYTLIDSPEDRPLRPEEFLPLVPDVDGIILGVDEITAEVFDQAPQLKVLSRCGVGLDGVDLAAAKERGIVVKNTPGSNSVAVAELTIGLMVSLARRIPYHDAVVKRGDWSRISGMELAGATLGLIGFGNIGREVAKRAAVFGMRILFYDPYPPSEEVLAKISAEARSVEEILTESDVVSLHIPLLPQTQNLINATALERMKSSAYLINTARGGLVDEMALYEALANGGIAGAAFDAFSQEPPREHPLLTLDNFIGMPHIGASTRQTALRTSLMASENLLSVLEK